MVSPETVCIGITDVKTLQNIESMEQCNEGRQNYTILYYKSNYYKNKPV